MALIPLDNETGDSNVDTGGDDYYYDYYYDYDYSDNDDGVYWPYLLFDVLLGVAVVVDLLLIVVVLSGSKLRRGPSAVFIISLAVFDLFHLISIRLSLYFSWQLTMHPAAHVICKVTSYTSFSTFSNGHSFFLRGWANV